MKRHPFYIAFDQSLLERDDWTEATELWLAKIAKFALEKGTEIDLFFQPFGFGRAEISKFMAERVLSVRACEPKSTLLEAFNHIEKELDQTRRTLCEDLHSPVIVVVEQSLAMSSLKPHADWLSRCELVLLDVSKVATDREAILSTFPSAKYDLVNLPGSLIDTHRGLVLMLDSLTDGWEMELPGTAHREYSAKAGELNTPAKLDVSNDDGCYSPSLADHQNASESTRKDTVQKLLAKLVKQASRDRAYLSTREHDSKMAEQLEHYLHRRLHEVGGERNPWQPISIAFIKDSVPHLASLRIYERDFPIYPLSGLAKQAKNLMAMRWQSISRVQGKECITAMDGILRAYAESTSDVRFLNRPPMREAYESSLLQVSQASEALALPTTIFGNLRLKVTQALEAACASVARLIEDAENRLAQDYNGWEIVLDHAKCLSRDPAHRIERLSKVAEIVSHWKAGSRLLSGMGIVSLASCIDDIENVSKGEVCRYLAFVRHCGEICQSRNQEISEGFWNDLNFLEDTVNHWGEPPRIEDLVRCTVFARKDIRPATQGLVQVLLHLPEQAEAAKTAATETDAQTQKRGESDLDVPIRWGEKVTIRLLAEGLLIDEPAQTTVWHGTPQAVSFVVTCPHNAIPTQLWVKVLVEREQLPIGRLVFSVQVVSDVALPPATEVELVQGKRTHFRSAFASYASEDRHAVISHTRLLPYLGTDVFLDVLSLAPGQRWEQELYRHIDKCDLFLLFWSTASSESPWVRKETQYALELQGRNPSRTPEIWPVILPPPPPAKPWPDIKLLHVNDWVTYVMGMPPHTAMHPAYFETRFAPDNSQLGWPPEFAIISAFAPTGEWRSNEQNDEADRDLEKRLRSRFGTVTRVTGYSPDTDHAELSWAVAAKWEEACDIGRAYFQDAIYYVIGDDLWVSFCDSRRSLVQVGTFRDRLTSKTPTSP